MCAVLGIVACSLKGGVRVGVRDRPPVPTPRVGVETFSIRETPRHENAQFGSPFRNASTLVGFVCV